MTQLMIQNPILPGFYPDPSICRVEDDFYMVCSSFEMYPGIPIFHSKDLAHWEQIGYVMYKENDFHVEANVFAGGVMAPTIRYHKGVFYVINTNFCDKGNYIVTATNPVGPWSKPHWLADVPGIDASLFIDEDDLAYVIGTGDVVKRADGSMDRGIWLCEFDLKEMKTIGTISTIWDSALRVATSPEAPHLYKVGSYYYLVIAEGGTEHYHAVTVARSKELCGWYEGNPANPVMTHRQFGFDYPIANIGHADFVDTPSGNWYAVLLGSRTVDGIHKNLGRETYICPVIWERDWPVFSPKTGKVDWEYEADKTLPWVEYEQEPIKDEFLEKELGLQWNFWGTPYEDFWTVEDSMLKLKCSKRTTSDPLKALRLQEGIKTVDACVSFVGRRQVHIDFEAFCEMNFMPLEEDSAGFVVMQASNHQYKVERAKQNGEQVIRLLQITTKMEVPPHMLNFTSTTVVKELVSLPYLGKNIVIGLKATGQNYDFYYGTSMDTLHLLYEHADGKIINPEVISGMVGTMLGMYASGNQKVSENRAEFDWFSYEGK